MLGENDIVFISYGEKNADNNYQHLQRRFPGAKRVNNVKGIENAYRMAASMCTSAYFYVVDADNIILPDFQFDYKPDDDKYGTFVWQAINPINGLQYGFGGVKLYNRSSFLIRKSETDLSVDFLNSYDFPVVNSIRFISEAASITHFNSSGFDAWRGAFRECCKLTAFGAYLMHKPKQLLDDSQRLKVWCSTGADKPFGEWVIRGAEDGREWGMMYRNDLSKLNLINDYAWLRTHYETKYNNILCFP